MLILDTLSEISFYRLGLIFKSIVNVVCIFVPLMIAILCFSDIYKIVFKPDEAKENVKKAFDRIIAGLIIFIIPSTINYTMSLIDGYQPDTLLKYYNGASKEKIEQLKIQYNQEQTAAANKREAEYKEAGKRIANEEAKIKQQKEEAFKEWQEKNKPSGNNNGGTTGNNGGTTGTNPGDSGGTTVNPGGSGTFGSVTVSNGVFTIPNKRATSEADIPKQSGQYGLNPVFWERLNKFIQAANAAGYKITVSSGWRSYSSQRSLWDKSTRPCSTRSKWVACPGGSRHGFGIAADLKFNGSSCSGGWDCNAAAKWAHANAGNYGLKFRMNWEPWHIEPAQVNGGNFGSCNASC
ncbi:MAG: D-alanyl-D-alanine carboxypeptidase family protein [Bacilli bacterium]|nr:D-alanyl-D-alanine carboxypeptidase family protein [Bacilli bacterium]